MCPSGSSSTSFVWRAVRSPFARSLLAALGWLALPAPALAQLAPVAQSRSASFSWSDSEGTYFCFPPPAGCTPVNVVHSDDQGDDQAPDFASFATSLGGIVSLDSSALGPQGFSASATHAGSGIAVYQPTGPPGEVYAHSRTTTSEASFSFTFTVAEETPFHLTGEVATSGAGFLGSMLARIRMTGPGGELVAVELIDDDDCFDPECLDLGPEAVDLVGTLLPGSYTVEADLQGLAEPLISISTGIAAANDYAGSFELALSTPVPAPSSGPLGLVALVLALGAIAHRRLG